MPTMEACKTITAREVMAKAARSEWDIIVTSQIVSSGNGNYFSRIVERGGCLMAAAANIA